jgi:hypothetical protein
MTIEKNNIEAVKKENEDKLNQDKDKELDNVKTTPPKAKYDISITSSFYKQSKGVDQVTMIIPKRDDEKHNGKAKTASLDISKVTGTFSVSGIVSILFFGCTGKGDSLNIVSFSDLGIRLNSGGSLTKTSLF